ncbi:MAG TPA: D-alanyl-D-alanine carboxypeptidase family protein [Bacillales bacterium]|nr:D-alanyl-D-alanine carboxypeptidase family protein [Bacillales bacterium]
MKSLIQRGLFIIITVLLAGATIFPKASTVEAAAPPIDLKAPAAILLDANTGKILYAKNADQMKAPASMSKMMTEYLIFEAIKKGKISWDSKVHISNYAYKVSQNYHLSNVPLRRDVTYTVKELFKAMEIESANGAAIALAERVAGTEAKFVQMMNQKAKELGLKKAKFVNCTGLDNSDLYGHTPAGGPNSKNLMSTRAVAKLAYDLLNTYPAILQFSSIAKEKFTKGFPKDQPMQMKNWNWMLPGLIYAYKGMDGLKTGSTPQDGYSFTGTAKRHGLRLLSVVMDTDSYHDRFAQTRILMNYGFENFHKVTLLNKGYVPKNKKQLSVTKGKTDSVSIETSQPVQMLIRNGTKKKYKPKFTLDQSQLNKDGALTAPVKKGQKVGAVKVVYSGGKQYGYITNDHGHPNVTPVVTTNSVEKASWLTLTFRNIGSFFSNFFSGISDMVGSWI